MENVTILHWCKCTIGLDQTVSQFELINQQFQTSTINKNGAFKKKIKKILVNLFNH